MLCYMKKCPTIYVKIDIVHIWTRAALGFKSILQNKIKNVTIWLHYWLSFTLTEMLSSLKKITKYITYT